MAHRTSQCRWIAGLVIWTSLGIAGSAQAAADPAAMAKFRRAIDDYLAVSHVTPTSIDRDGLLREIEGKLARGENPRTVYAWMTRATQERWYAFAPIDPPIPPQPLFQLPFDSRVHWLVSQGVAGGLSHTGWQEFAFDFAMPEGTPIFAAQRGRVVRVVDGFTLCCRTADKGFQANAVYVRHSGGVVSMYAHLRKGIVVREGQKVGVGELLGFSGSTGYANAPHLHFAVAVRKGPLQMQTIPIRFRDGTPEGYVPKPWHFYENRPPARVELRVSINGAPAVSGRPFPLANHAPVQLSVERVGPAGATLDVTRNSGTQYVALTPWSLRIDRMGRVQFDLHTRTWGFLVDFIERGVAMLTIIARDESGQEGYFDVWFKFADVELPARSPPPGAPAGAGAALRNP